jgi:uncharacterized protein (TIGR03118 family)
MKSSFLRLRVASSTLLVLISLAVFAPAAENARSFYVVKNLVSDGTTTPHTDPHLVNGWGIAAAPFTPWWVADAGTQKASIYTAFGTVLPFVVDVPGVPTGLVTNPGKHFKIPKGKLSLPAAFIFASRDGTISAWNVLDSTKAVVVFSNALQGAAYTGLAIASTPGGDFLYAADFHNGRVEVLDGTFHIAGGTGTFVDPGIPTGFAPFGIQNIAGRIYVAYAKVDPVTGRSVHGAGLGYVSAFDTAGTFLGRIAAQGALNAPWGMAIAPATGFGPLSGHLLVGNFGDGYINAYEAAAPYAAKGPLKDKAGMPLAIDGLWGIAFGNGLLAGPKNVLFFAAGPANEGHGLFGSIKFKQTLF